MSRAPLKEVLTDSIKGPTHRTLAERAFEALHEAIVSGQLEPGQRLPINDLADGLGMSPMPVREALRRLDSAGLVQHVPHKGATVAMLSVEDLFDVYRARLVLEPLVIHEAALRFGPDDVEEAASQLQQFETLIGNGPSHEAWQAHTRFHFSLYARADSRWLVRSVKPLWESSERYRHASRIRNSRIDDRQREHKAILDACSSGDGPQAALKLYNHLAHSANEVAAAMGSDDLFRIASSVDDLTIWPGPGDLPVVAETIP